MPPLWWPRRILTSKNSVPSHIVPATAPASVTPIVPFAGAPLGCPPKSAGGSKYQTDWLSTGTETSLEPTSTTVDPTLPMISLDLSRVTENATLISVLMTCASAWMESALLDPAGGQRWVVYDEAWRLMSHPSLLRRMDAHWRLARHYGIANMLIFHKLTDLDTVGDQGSAMRALASSLLANAETRIIYRQESDQLGATADALGLTGTERQLLPTLGTGQGLWRIKDRSFVCQHQLHPAELELFDTTARMR